MNSELSSSLDYLEKEKGLKRDVLLEALRQALVSACRKTYPNRENIEIQIDPTTFVIRLLSDGKLINDAEFGRIAAQTAKQVIIQKIREAQRESIFDEYTRRTDDIATGTVHRIENKAIIVDFGKTEGILPAREQSPADHYRQGDIIRAYVLEVKKTSRGPEVILSRSHSNFVKKLFELEVPEISDGIVQIKGAAREAGSRTKIAVLSSDSKIDCVGSCVGVRGQRVKNIVRELEGEKIDIIPFSDETETYIRNAMQPAELAEVKLYRKEMVAEIIVEDDQLSLAIGKKGQNVRLAGKLVGWKLDVRSRSQRVPLASVEGMNDAIENALKEAGIVTIKDMIKLSPDELSKTTGLDVDSAEKMIHAAQKALIERGKDSKDSDKNKEIKEIVEKGPAENEGS